MKTAPVAFFVLCGISVALPSQASFFSNSVSAILHLVFQLSRSPAQAPTRPRRNACLFPASATSSALVSSPRASEPNWHFRPWGGLCIQSRPGITEAVHCTYKAKKRPLTLGFFSNVPKWPCSSPPPSYSILPQGEGGSDSSMFSYTGMCCWIGFGYVSPGHLGINPLVDDQTFHVLLLDMVWCLRSRLKQGPKSTWIFFWKAIIIYWLLRVRVSQCQRHTQPIPNDL